MIARDREIGKPEEPTAEIAESAEEQLATDEHGRAQIGEEEEFTATDAEPSDDRVIARDREIGKPEEPTADCAENAEEEEVAADLHRSTQIGRRRCGGRSSRRRFTQKRADRRRGASVAIVVWQIAVMLQSPANSELAAMTQPRFATYEEFFTFYLSEHSDRRNRMMHAAGTLLGLCMLIVPIAVGHPWYALLWPVASYGFAWTGHFLIEGNRPATFGHPVWSFISDFRMLGLMMTGRLQERMAKTRERSASH